MKVQVTQENLSFALSNASRIANEKTSLPILSNILLRTENNRLLVAATNLEVSSSNLIGAKVQSQGVITIPARILTEFVSNLPKDVIDLEVKKSQLTITSGNYTSTINGMESEEFPELPEVDEASSVRIDLSVASFKEAVAQTIITASNDSTRPVLTGVYWHVFEGFLYLAATDGYRLSERKLIETTAEISSIIPTSTLQEVLRSTHDSIESIEILFTESEVHFRLGDVVITSRLIDGKFPDYRQLIPSTSEVSAHIPKKELVRIVKIASLFARESGGGVTLNIDKDANVLSINSITSEVGENTSKADLMDVTESGSITLNSRYLNDALSVLNEEEITFGFSGKLSPFVLSGISVDTTYKHIVMPLKS